MAPASSLIPEGLCQCGCGAKTAIALQSHTKHGYVKGKPRRFLSGHHRRVASKLDIVSRFLGKYEVSQNGCWEWQAATWLGYGRFGVDGRVVLAHRFAYEHFVGPVPEGFELDHLCRNPRCCNPAHLEPVSHRENVRRGTSTNKGMCRNGHELSPDNVCQWAARKGFTACRVCVRERQKRNRGRINEMQRRRRAALVSEVQS